MGSEGDLSNMIPHARDGKLVYPQATFGEHRLPRIACMSLTLTPDKSPNQRINV
jgi:hypothetical protein